VPISQSVDIECGLNSNLNLLKTSIFNNFIRRKTVEIQYKQTAIHAIQEQYTKKQTFVCALKIVISPDNCSHIQQYGNKLN